MSRLPPVGAWLALMRISNAPTVISQVFAGVAVGMHSLGQDEIIPVGTTTLIATGVLLTYLAGMTLNDAFDARVDAVERPGRPIPSGAISLSMAWSVGAAMFLAGMAVLAVASPSTMHWAFLLGLSVLAYNTLHTLTAGSFVLMAACRALVPVVAACSVSPVVEWSLLAWIAGGSFLSIAAVSVAARNEVVGFGTLARVASWFLPIAACAPLGLWLVGGVAPRDPVQATAVLGVMALAVVSVLFGIRTAMVTKSPRAVPAAVGIWIGTIPIIDSGTCFLLGRPVLGVLCMGMWAAARLLRPRFASS